MSTPELDAETLASWLGAHPSWTVADGKLHRVYVFEDFVTAFAWMGRVADEAEAMNHHPEWLNVYRTVSVWLTTHDAGGLTELDLRLAEIMDRRHMS